MLAAWRCLCEVFVCGGVCAWKCLYVEVFVLGGVCAWSCLCLDVFAPGGVCAIWRFWISGQLIGQLCPYGSSLVLCHESWPYMSPCQFSVKQQEGKYCSQTNIPQIDRWCCVKPSHANISISLQFYSQYKHKHIYLSTALPPIQTQHLTLNTDSFPRQKLSELGLPSPRGKGRDTPFDPYTVR